MERNNRKILDYSFLTLGLLVQVVTYFISNSLSPGSLTPLSLISGLLGICSVCLASQGNILTYLFGFGQVGTYMALIVSQRFYGQIALNTFYLITMIYGVYVWKKHLHADSRHVTPRQLRLPVMIVIAVSTLVLSWIAGWGMESWTQHEQPYLDAYTTIPALVAQVLMILVYREHWFVWLAVDVLNVVLWIRAGDYCMTAQYVFWCANCLYGLKRWKKLSASDF